MNLTTAQTKQLVEKYPYLAPHNSWTGDVVEDYDYTYTEAWGLPSGWHRLFYMLCKHLKPHLEKANLLNRFYFTQIKEKYGTMRVYTSALPDSVDHMIDLYECYSKYICQSCGEPSEYCTTGWIAHLCGNCIKGDKESAERVNRTNVATFNCYTADSGYYKLQYSYRPIRTEYNKIRGMSDEEFFNYLIED